MSRKLMITVCLAMLLPVPCAPVEAHGGGLDSSGCHHNRKTGDYHCHRAVRSDSASSLSTSSAAPSYQESSLPVKMTRSAVCHDAQSPQYSDFQDVTLFPDMERCIRSGGRHWDGRKIVLDPLRHTPAYGDETVKLTKSGVCYRRSHIDWSSIVKFDSFPDLYSCLRSGGRLPK